MKLALLNTLSDGRGGGINPDGLSLDLQFAADKTLTARRGPTPTFSRASGATYIGSDGLIHGIDTSTTSNTIGTGSRTFTLAATAGQDQFWRTGDAVEASNGANIMTGTVTSYTPSTQSLVCNMTSIGGSGTFTSWRIGYRGPRFDHDPVTLACKGLLIEEGRTNLLARSQEFNLSPWGTNNAMTVTPDATIAPDGTLTADAINFDTNILSRVIYVAGSAVVHTFSVWLRADTNKTCIIATGAVGSEQLGGVVNVTTTWQRFSVVASNWPSGTASFNVRIANNATGTSGTIFAWGAQLEAGSSPTSYIPTTTGSVVRSADVCSITGGDFNNFYNQSEGAFLLKATSLMATATAGNRTFFSFTDGGYSNQQGLFKSANTNELNLPLGTGTGPAIGTLTAGSPFAVSGAFAASNCAASFNGAAAVTVAGSPSTVVTKLEFRDPTAASAGHPTMHISQFRYYKKRLSNAKLVQLTV
jgi:hypothetical protein